MPTTAPAPPAPPPPDNFVTPPTTPEQSEQELETTSVQEQFAKVSHTGLKIVSVLLLIHGLYGLYNELIDIFYVFPHVPEIIKSLNFSQSLYQDLLRRSILTGTTALLETIYGVILLTKGKSLAHHIHLISAIGLFVVSLIISTSSSPIDLESHNAPIPPTIPNLIRQNSFSGALQLFSRP